MGCSMLPFTMTHVSHQEQDLLQCTTAVMPWTYLRRLVRLVLSTMSA